MIKVLFVCHGNICRSTMAQFLFQHLAEEMGYAVTCNKKEDADFMVDSAATSREEIGNPVDPRTAAKLKEHGIRCGTHYARQITKADYACFDRIIIMDRENEWGIHRILLQDPEQKIHRMMEYTDGTENCGAGQKTRDVADPWYTHDFEQTYQDLLQGCSGLLVYLTNRSK